MNIKQFIKKYDLKNIPFPLDDNISENIRTEFNKNRESIIASYFEDVFEKLDNQKFSELYENHIIFGLYPFSQKNGMQFLRVIKKINRVIKNDPNKITIDLLDFEWTLLDHILHEYLNEEVEMEFRSELILLKEQTENLNKFKDEVALLHQKIGHFGIK